MVAHKATSNTYMTGMPGTEKTHVRDGNGSSFVYV